MPIPVTIIDDADRAAFAAGTVLAAGLGSFRVLRLADGTIVKRFRRDGGWFPWRGMRVRRFVENAERLERLGFRSVQVTRRIYDPETRTHLAVYPGLTGESFRDVAAEDEDVLTELPALFALLHDRGVYFRAAHLGNLIRGKPVGIPRSIGLIDIVDIRFRSQPLSTNHRARNLVHLFGNRIDHTVMEAFGLDRFLDLYAALPGGGRAQGIRHQVVRALTRAGKA